MHPVDETYIEYPSFGSLPLDSLNCIEEECPGSAKVTVRLHVSVNQDFNCLEAKPNVSFVIAMLKALPKTNNPGF
jgi:hypothetical protein